MYFCYSMVNDILQQREVLLCEPYTSQNWPYSLHGLQKHAKIAANVQLLSVQQGKDDYYAQPLIWCTRTQFTFTTAFKNYHNFDVLIFQCLDIQLKGTVSQDGFWLLITCLVSFRPKQRTEAFLKFFRCSYHFLTQKYFSRLMRV